MSIRSLNQAFNVDILNVYFQVVVFLSENVTLYQKYDIFILFQFVKDHKTKMLE